MLDLFDVKLFRKSRRKVSIMRNKSTKKYGIRRVIYYTRRHHGKIPIHLAHQMMSEPDMTNKSGRPNFEKAWITKMLWWNGSYYKDHCFALYKQKISYHDPHSNTMNAMAIKKLDGTILKWGSQFKPCRPNQSLHGRMPRMFLVNQGLPARHSP